MKWNVCMEERCFAQQRTRIRRMTADVPSSAARCGARRFTLWWSKSRQHGGPPKSTLAPVRGTIPAWPAGCSPSAKRSMQVNATRPDAQRLQSATCRKQPGARRCRRAAGGRCITICSFFPSYSRPSFSPPSLSRDHRSCTYVREHRTSCVRLSDGSTTDIYAQFSGIASEGVSATSWTS